MSYARTWARLHSARLSRRALLEASARGGVGATGLALVGCGGDDENAEPQAEQESQQQAEENQAHRQAQQLAEEPPAPETPGSPRSGGVISLFAATESHDRWDPHRSRFAQTQLFHSLMYNRLVRFNSVSAGRLEPDLANLPEMPDEATYLFTLRLGIQFWDRPPTDGRLVTAEDIRFNVQRQIDAQDSAGNPDPLFFRQSAYQRTDSMEVTGDRNITFRTDGPDATYLASVHAGPWSWITAPEAVEEFGAAWRDDTDNVSLNSGTGPYVPVSYGRQGDLALRRSENWWAARTSGFADGIFLRRVPNSQIAALYRGGTLDRADFPLSNTAIESLRQELPNHTPYEFPLDTPIQLQYVIPDDPENPLRDPRVGQALGSALNRFDLIDRLYLGEGRPSGPVPWFLDDWTLPEEELLTRPGYRPNKEDDLPDLRALLSAAGGADSIGAVEIVVPDLFEGFFPGIAQNLKTMLERNLEIKIHTMFLSYGEITRGLQDESVTAFFGWGPAPRQADPTDEWLRVAHSDGAENWGHYANPDVDALVDRMRTTLDQAERQTLARQVQDLLLETGFWIQNVANGIQLGIAEPFLHTDLRALDFAWAGHHLAATWVDVNDPTYNAARTAAEFPEETAAGS